MHRTLFITLILFVVGGIHLPSLASAQNENVEQEDESDPQEKLMRDRKLRRVVQRRRAAELKFKNTIAAIDRVCDLADDQVRKLQVAAKGAINSHMSKANSRMLKNLEGGLIEDLDVNAEPEVKKENADRKLLKKFSSVNFGKEKIWKSSLAKVLSEEQMEKWEFELDARFESSKRTAAIRFVEEADKLIFMSAEQKSAVVTSVQETMGEILVALPDLRRTGNFKLTAEPGDPVAVETKAREVLTGSQLEIWTSAFQPKLVRLKQIGDEIFDDQQDWANDREMNDDEMSDEEDGLDATVERDEVTRLKDLIREKFRFSPRPFEGAGF